MRRTLSLLCLVAVCTASARASLHAVQRQSTDCDAVHLFLARGNNEPYPGRQAAIIEAICDGVANCGYEDLIYSALYTDLSCQTAYDGVLAAYDQLSSYACRCPYAKLILLGYSQGAQIATDLLGGGGGTLFNGCKQPDTPALGRNTALGKRVNAIVIFGDTHHTANQPYNQGGGSGLDGIFPRPENQLQALEQWRSALWSFCGPNDPVCANSGPKKDYNVTEHLGYYNDTALLGQAAAWAKNVAGIKDDSSFTTTVPTSLSGTAQDHSTIPSTFVPGGTVQTHALVTSACAASSESSPVTTSSNPTSHATSTTVSAPISSKDTESVPSRTSLLPASASTAARGPGESAITSSTNSDSSRTSSQRQSASATTSESGASALTVTTLTIFKTLAFAIIILKI